MKHTIRRFVPVDSLDIPAMESWLSDLAEDGLFLVSFGTYFAKFESRSPRKTAYRLEPAPSLYMMPDEKKLAFLEEFGWEYVDSVDKYFHVFRAKTEDAPEIHTDPAVQAEAYEKLYRSQRNWGIPYVLTSLIFLYFIIFAEKAGFFQNALLGASHMFQGVYMAVVAVLGVHHFLRLLKIRNLLKNGALLSHSADYRRKHPLRLCACVFILLLFAATLITYTYESMITWHADWRELSEPVPMVSLAEIEQAQALQNGHAKPATFLYGDMRNEIRFDRSFLVPEQITITQSGFIPGKNWAGSSEPYEPTLSLHIYRLRYLSDGERFVKSQMDWELSRVSSPWDTFNLTAETGLNEAFLCVNSHSDRGASQLLFLRQDETVLFAEYHGEADLSPFVPQFAALMQENYPTKKPR